MTEQPVRRLPVDEVAPVLDAARSAGLWHDESRAVVFHDLARMEADLDRLHAGFPADTLHSVAIKANPVVRLLAAVVDRGAGLEAASWEEVELARAAGCAPDRIVFDSPAKTDAELRAAAELGLWINADHEDELRRLEAIGVPAGTQVGLRVNPGSGAGSIGFTSTVSADSKFGVPLEQAADLVARYPFVRGLHVHTGSQGVALELIDAAVNATCDAAAALDLDWVDVGGGLPVRYTDADPEPPTLDDWTAMLSRTTAWGSRRLVTELGRWIQAGRGWLVSRIEAVKDVNGVRTMVVHAGADMFLRRVYQPGSWDHEMVVLDSHGNPKAGPAEPTTVAGPLCFSGDLLAVERPLTLAERGDLLLIRDVGAYTLAMWSRHCSRGLPPVVGHRGTEVVELFAGEDPGDVVAFWS